MSHLIVDRIVGMATFIASLTLLSLFMGDLTRDESLYFMLVILDILAGATGLWLAMRKPK